MTKERRKEIEVLAHDDAAMSRILMRKAIRDCLAEIDRREELIKTLANRVRSHVVCSTPQCFDCNIVHEADEVIRG